MSGRFLAVRDGGKTGEEGAMRLFAKLAGSQNQGRVGSGSLAVSQNGTPNMSVNVATGDIVIAYNDYIYHGWVTATQNKTITTSDPSNPRIDRVVAYIDRAVLGTTNSNNPDALVFAVVAGTAAGSPVRANDATVQAAIGAGNPFVNLADVRVEAGITTIVDAKITDTRPLFVLGGGVGGIQFTVDGSLFVQNKLTRSWIAPSAGTFTSVYARVDTAPTGAALNFRIKKNGVQVATVSISAGAQTANSTGNSISFSAGDYFDIDCTQIGSIIAGADATVSVG